MFAIYCELISAGLQKTQEKVRSPWFLLYLHDTSNQYSTSAIKSHSLGGIFIFHCGKCVQSFISILLVYSNTYDNRLKQQEGHHGGTILGIEYIYPP
jgi:hypothetical protein